MGASMARSKTRVEPASRRFGAAMTAPILDVADLVTAYRLDGRCV